MKILTDLGALSSELSEVRRRVSTIEIRNGDLTNVDVGVIAQTLASTKFK
jgi:hypothetical protein